MIAEPYVIYEHWIEQGPEWPILGKYREMDAVYRARIIAFMAGAEAEKELLGVCNGGDGDDQYQIALMGGGLVNTHAEAWPSLAARLRRQTARLVRMHRDKIKRVALALSKRKTGRAPAHVTA